MTNRYTVIQYLPDALAGECLNAGVIVYRGGHVRARFVSDWHRLKLFGKGDIGFLKEFAANIRKMTRSAVMPPAPDGSGTLDEATLNNMILTWSNEIRFTPPRVSIRALDELYEEAVSQFLHESLNLVKDYRTREDAVRMTQNAIRAAVELVLPSQSRKLVKTDEVVKGKQDACKFDIVVINGQPWLAADALSFERPDSRSLERAVNAALWGIRDVREQAPDFPIGVLALPPHEESEIFPRAARLLDMYSVPLFRDEQALSMWAGEALARRAF